MRRNVTRLGIAAVVAAVAIAVIVGLVIRSGSPPQASAHAPPSSAPSSPVTRCAAAVVHHEAPPGIARQAGIPPTFPWIEDAQVQITGSLFYYTPALRRYSHVIIGTRGHATGGRSTKILWWVRGKGSPTLTIVGHRTDANGTFHQTITGPSLGNNTTFPSIVTIPNQGCWTLDVHSGSTSASVTLRAITLNPHT